MQRLCDFAGHMRRLEVDNYEFVAIKVLMLLTPGTRMLSLIRLVTHYIQTIILF